MMNTGRYRSSYTTYVTEISVYNCSVLKTYYYYYNYTHCILRTVENCSTPIEGAADEDIESTACFWFTLVLQVAGNLASQWNAVIFIFIVINSKQLQFSETIVSMFSYIIPMLCLYGN